MDKDRSPSCRQDEEGEGDTQEKVNNAGADGVKVSSKKVKVNPAGGNESGKPKSVKVGGTISEQSQGQAKVSSPAPVAMMTRSAAAAAMRSGDRSTEKSAEEDEATAHPCLFIESVLDVVFKHLVNQPGPRTAISNDVQNIRLVCKTWRTSITRLYRQTRPETEFFSYSQRGRPRRGSKSESLSQFMKTMNSSQMIPVQKYTFGGEVFRRGNLKMFREFLLICGPEVVELSMTIDSGDPERIMANLENLPTLEMRKLKTLSLEIFDEAAQPRDNFEDLGLVKLFEFLLIAANTLKELRLDHSGLYDDQRQVALVAKQLGLVMAKRIPRTVRELELSMEMDEPTLNNLEGVGLELERFQFGVPTVLRGGSRTLYQFLQSQAATLKRFRLSSEEGGLLVEFPPLHELVDLELGDVIISIAAGSDFAKIFPKLASLHLGGMHTGKAFQALLSSVKASAPPLKVLHLPAWRRTSLAPIIKDVAQSFPCLVELHIWPYNSSKETLLEVFNCFPNLESLNICFCGRDLLRTVNSIHWGDCLLSGISEPDCSKISGVRDLGSVNLAEFRRQPSILNFTKLRKLTVESNFYNPSAPRPRSLAFTDVSAHFILQEMAHLQELHFANISVLFSPRYMDLLRGRLTVGYWSYL